MKQAGYLDSPHNENGQSVDVDFNAQKYPKGKCSKCGRPKGGFCASCKMWLCPACHAFI